MGWPWVQAAESLTNQPKSQELGTCSAPHPEQLITPECSLAEVEVDTPGLAAKQSCQQPGGLAATLPPDPGWSLQGADLGRVAEGERDSQWCLPNAGVYPGKGTEVGGRGVQVSSQVWSFLAVSCGVAKGAVRRGEELGSEGSGEAGAPRPVPVGGAPSGAHCPCPSPVTSSASGTRCGPDQV